MEQTSIIRFGDFTLDGAQRRLLRAGQDVYLPPKTFELLLYLVRNGGRVIPKDELLEALWPDVNVVENTLAQRIRELREALGEGAHSARFIKTVPRVGYQFVAVLDDEPPNTTAPPLISASPEKVGVGTGSLVLFGAGLLALVALLTTTSQRANLADSTLRPPVGIGLWQDLRGFQASRPMAAPWPSSMKSTVDRRCGSVA